MLSCHKNTKNWIAQPTQNHLQSESKTFLQVNPALRSGFDCMPKIMLRLPNYSQATEGNRGSYSLKSADFKSGFLFFLKWRRATPDINEVRALPSNQCVFPTFSLLNLQVLVPKLRNETSRIEFHSKKDARKNMANHEWSFRYIDQPTCKQRRTGLIMLKLRSVKRFFHSLSKAVSSAETLGRFIVLPTFSLFQNLKSKSHWRKSLETGY